MFVGCRAELLMPVETPQVQFSDKSALDRALFLERILRQVGLRSHGVWRSECCGLSCRSAEARGNSTGAVLGHLLRC